MAHTPGPWWVDAGPGEGVEVHDGFGHTASVWGDEDTATANARLIAAAPEMLKQLRAVRDDIGALACDTNGWREWDATAVDELLGSRLVRLDELIAKAEGGK